MWDTAGQESYRSLLPLYYRGASIVVLVYDITNEDSLEQTKWWGGVVFSWRNRNSYCLHRRVLCV